MKVIQILPELNSGGVERGTLEVGKYLFEQGHGSLVISNGGRLVEKLEREGSRHIQLPVHRKSLLSLFQVRKLRALFEKEKPDIIHIRSRVPGWLAWLAWRGMGLASRPRLVSTVHGFYSVNAYSAIMTKGERVIAVSESVQDYILKNYPKTDPAIIRVIHRGVDEIRAFPGGFTPSSDWLAKWKQQNPALEGRIILLMPARLTRWKGQEHFLQLIARLLEAGRPVHGLLAGEPHVRKQAFLEELQTLSSKLGISEHVTFLGHRSDLREIMAVSEIAYSLSLNPEAFGRVSLEAMASGKPVVGYDHGGVAEQLSVIFPPGRVPAGDVEAAVETTCEILDRQDRPSGITDGFTLDSMLRQTLAVYEELVTK